MSVKYFQAKHGQEPFLSSPSQETLVLGNKAEPAMEGQGRVP